MGWQVMAALTLEKPGGATVYLQIIDPRAFGGLDRFTRQLGTVADQCNASRSVNPSVPVVGG